MLRDLFIERDKFMGERMEFPKDPKEFIKKYSFKDNKELYTNGAELVPLFRVNQMIEHYMNNPNWGKVLADTGKYRLVEGLGSYFNRRYEVQERYSYYEGKEQVTSYHMVCFSSDYEIAKKMYMRRLEEK